MIRLPRIQSKNDVNLLQSGGEARKLPCVRSSEKVIPAGASEKQKLGFSMGLGRGSVCYCVFVCVVCMLCFVVVCMLCVHCCLCVSLVWVFLYLFVCCCWVYVFCVFACVYCFVLCCFLGGCTVAERVWRSRGPAGAKQIGSTAESFSSGGQETLGLGCPWWHSG